jgi:hypothetical protein
MFYLLILLCVAANLRPHIDEQERVLGSHAAELSLSGV